MLVTEWLLKEPGGTSYLLVRPWGLGLTKTSLHVCVSV